jgi:hypothetical protein
MHHRTICAIIGVAVVIGAGCQRRLTPTESKLIGNWSTSNSTNLTDDGFAGPNAGFIVTTFKADHTFFQTNHPNDRPAFQELSGTWHAQGDQLVLKFTGDPSGEMVGQDLQFVLSDLQPTRFVGANAPNQKQKLVWTRVK